MKNAVVICLLLIMVFVVGCATQGTNRQIVSQPVQKVSPDPQVQVPPVTAESLPPVEAPAQTAQQPVISEPQPATSDTQMAAASASVTIQNFAFSPATVTIRKGGSVTWTQKDSVKHNAVSDDGKFEGPLLNLGDTWTFKFDEAGNYKYHCGPHPRMTGTVVVV